MEQQQYPQHVAIIPDGNRTRATGKGYPEKYGHYQAYKLTLQLIDFVFDKTPIKAFTFW
jgi:undecaprenyl diphosphate synthase